MAVLSRRRTDAIISLPEAGPGPSWVSPQPGLGSCPSGCPCPKTSTAWISETFRRSCMWALKNDEIGVKK